MKTTSVLAIDPGSREFGYAHFLGAELVDENVKSLRRPGEDRLHVLARVFRQLLVEKRPTVLAIEKNNFAAIPQNRMAVEAVVTMLSIAQSLHISVYAFAANTVRKTVAGDGRATKRMLARVICAQLPRLRPYLAHPLMWQERYYGNLFDAVATGLTYLALEKVNALEGYAV